MRFVYFSHAPLTDGSNSLAPFLKGIAGEVQARGHAFRIVEPAPAELRLTLGLLCRGADVVIAHDGTQRGLIAALARRRAAGAPWLLLLHSTGFRRTDIASDLHRFDAILASGRCSAPPERHPPVQVWPLAADTRRLRPLTAAAEGDVVFLGNWAEGERAVDLRTFLIEPVRLLGLKARVHGAPYPPGALVQLSQAGIEHGGWLPNPRVPETLSRFRATIHIPSRSHARALPGTPTLRMFEAMACGVPLISALWYDDEHLFTAGRDYLLAHDGAEMRRHLRTLLHEPALAAALAEHARRTIVARHSCVQRVDQLLAVCRDLQSALVVEAALPTPFAAPG